jgi:hypothetical protein
MRSLVSGWVENIRIMVRPENGLTIISALTGAVFAVGGSGLACTARSILARASASAIGSPVTSAPEASAAYSRDRLMAAWISPAASGPSRAIRRISRKPGPESSSLPPNPNNAPSCAMSSES